MPPHPDVHVGVAPVVIYDGCLLLVQRGGEGKFTSQGSGTWAVPGGWLELGESPWEAAEREALEETGVTVEAVADAGFVCNRSYCNTFQVVTLFVRCAYEFGEPTVMEPDKCPVVRWVPVDEVERLPLFYALSLWWPGADAAACRLAT